MTGWPKVWLAAVLMLLVSVRLVAVPPDVLVPQPPVTLSQGASGTWNTAWEGVPGRTYLMQWSQDMVNWNYFPLTESGAGTKAYGFASSTDKFFLRLFCSDETPDLVKTSVWQPPLLMAGGGWTVLARQRNGYPASGVGLAFYRWPANSVKPLSTPMSKARTAANGFCSFDPAGLDAGDRVEVRMTGSPNQRVYLPWLEGRETPDSNITPGGNGVALTGDLPGIGTGKVPDYDIIPGGGDDPGVTGEPVYRLEDFMSVSKDADRTSGDYESIYPIGGHQVAWEISDWFGNVSSGTRNTLSDDTNWLAGLEMGKGFLYDGGFFESTLSDNKLSVDYGDASLVTPIQRSIFVTQWIGVSDGWMINPHSTYQNEVFVFGDGATCDLGMATFPYRSDECDPAPPGSRTDYSRLAVLGPVPMYVPKSVLGGKPFYYNKLEDVLLYMELPFGANLDTGFVDPYGDTRIVPTEIEWSAIVSGPGDLEGMVTNGAGHAGLFGTTSTTEGVSPMGNISFRSTSASELPFQEDFSVTVNARLKVATAEHPPGEGGTEYSYDYAYCDLGSFTTEFEYSSAEGSITPARIAKRQEAELRGATGDAPESDGFNGGQRNKTLEPERRIGITGQPAPSSPSFVDALTGRFHHSETDFALAVPGSDLSLAVTRGVKDTVWTNAFGLDPSEDPLSVFGPGWDSNLTGSLLKVSDLMPDGTERVAPAVNPRNLNSNVSVRDYQGRTYTFLEYTNGDGVKSFSRDPTLLPERGTSGISLESANETTFSLTQPLLGFTHVYQKTTVDFRIANNRDTPTVAGNNVTGFTRFEYFRLTSVTDRFGVTLNYAYGSNPANLIPESISVQGRPALQLRFKQSAGKIDAFWDPAGIKHSFTYEPHNLAASGQPAATHSVLASHSVGALTTASYGYQYLVEEDPRPVSMLLKTTTGDDCRIPTYHIAPCSIANGKGDTVVVHQRLSDVRWAWSGAAKSCYPAAGDPMVVDSITLPNQNGVAFDLQHILKNGRPGKPAAGAFPEVPEIPAELSIVTAVTTMWGDHWRYEFGTPRAYHWLVPEADEKFLPGASALTFPGLQRACMEIEDSLMEFNYDASAGFALSRAKDEAGRKTSATHDEGCARPNPLYLPSAVSNGARMHSHFNLPSTTTDRLGHTTTYQYVNHPGNVDHLLVATVTDFRNRVVTPARGPHARTASIKVESGTSLLSQVDFAYDTALPGAVRKITRKAISGSGDPAWVTGLVKDIQLDGCGFPGRVGNDAANLHTTVTRSPSGRVLGVAAANGGICSNRYDSSGLLETSFLEDGSSRSYRHDLAGRTVFWRDALGNASGIVVDELGRTTKSVRDMNGNLGFDPAHGLSGIDPGTDIVSSSQFMDSLREARITDPRGFVSVRRSNALGQTTKVIAPGNDRAPGTLPNEARDRVTDIAYDLLQSPDTPVKVTDPLGYETIYRFDGSARLEMTLREYGTDLSGNVLHAGTVYGYDPATGQPDRVTSLRTPLDAAGNPVAGAALEPLVTRIIRDDLERPQTSIIAEGTDKELRSRDSYTSTGIRYRKEIRDSIADGATPEHWSAWELTCDALGRPTRRALPATVDALTGQTAVPFTDFIYDDFGNLSQTGDAYGNLTTYGHDVRGRVSYRKDPAVTDAKSGLIQEPVRTYGYDAGGMLVHEVDPLGYAWDHTRDAAGRVKTSTGPVVSPAASADRRRPVWENSYDCAGNLLQVIDPEGHTKIHGYYPDNRTKSTTTPVTFTDETGAGTLVDVVEQHGRDGRGRVVRVTDGRNQATAFTYDGLDRTLTTTRDPDDSRAKTETRVYDALLPVSIEDASGQIKEFGYDGQFRLSRIGVIGKPAESLDLTHDVLGNATGIAPVVPPADASMGDPAIARTYDVLGLLREETSNGVTTAYGYDLLGLMSSATSDANSRILTIRHDAAGRASRVVDINNGVTLTTRPGHDLAGNLVREEMSNGYTQETGFDPVRRVTSRRIRNDGDGGTVCRTDYQYDLLSNVTRVDESASQPGIPDRVIENTCNERSQLVTEIQTRGGGSSGGSIRTETHRYDAAENRIATGIETRVNGGMPSTLARAFDFGDPADGCNSNQLRQLTETADGDSPVVSTYAYDSNGSRTGKTTGAVTDVCSYDSFNRLTGFALNTAGSTDNGVWQYAYDPLTRRIARKATGQTARQFAFSGSTPAHEWEGALNNGSRLDHIGGGVGGRLYSQNAAGAVSYPFQNARGDITAEFSSGGAMTWHGTYDANGVLTDQSGARSGNYGANGVLTDQSGARSGNYGANGKWEEPGGLVNDGYRYRDRTTSTFLSRDPAGFIDGPNDYNYVGHNPWSAWDPNGLATSLYVPTGTADIGYVAASTFTGADGGIFHQLSAGGCMEHGFPEMSDLLPVYDYFSAIVEANAAPPEPVDLSYPLMWYALHMTAKEMSDLADSGELSPAESRLLMDESQRASDAEHDWKIITSTFEGLGWIISLIEPTPIGEEIMAGKTLGRLAEGGVGAAKTGAYAPGFDIWGKGLGKLEGKQIRVSRRGIDQVETHLSNPYFDQINANTAMIKRLEDAHSSGRKITGADASFYLHELSESTKMMRAGYSDDIYEASHAAALRQYNVSPFSVYHPDVILADPRGTWNNGFFKFWGIK